jgi:hypothetical protein
MTSIISGYGRYELLEVGPLMRVRMSGDGDGRRLDSSYDSGRLSLAKFIAMCQ